MRNLWVICGLVGVLGACARTDKASEAKFVDGYYLASGQERAPVFFIEGTKVLFLDYYGGNHLFIGKTRPASKLKYSGPTFEATYRLSQEGSYLRVTREGKQFRSGAWGSFRESYLLSSVDSIAYMGELITRHIKADTYNQGRIETFFKSTVGIDFPKGKEKTSTPASSPPASPSPAVVESAPAPGPEFHFDREKVRKNIADTLRRYKDLKLVEYDYSTIESEVEKLARDAYQGEPPVSYLVSARVTARSLVEKNIDEQLITVLLNQVESLGLATTQVVPAAQSPAMQPVLEYYQSEYGLGASDVVLLIGRLDGVAAAQGVSSGHARLGAAYLAPRSGKGEFPMQLTIPTAQLTDYKGSYGNLRLTAPVKIRHFEDFLFGGALRAAFGQEHLMLVQEDLYGKPSDLLTSVLVHEMRHYYDFQLHADWFDADARLKEHNEIIGRLNESKELSKTFDAMVASSEFKRFQDDFAAYRKDQGDTGSTDELQRRAYNVYVDFHNEAYGKLYPYYHSKVERRAFAEQVRWFKHARKMSEREAVSTMLFDINDFIARKDPKDRLKTLGSGKVVDVTPPRPAYLRDFFETLYREQP